MWVRTVGAGHGDRHVAQRDAQQPCLSLRPCRSAAWLRASCSHLSVDLATRKSSPSSRYWRRKRFNLQTLQPAFVEGKVMTANLALGVFIWINPAQL